MRENGAVFAWSLFCLDVYQLKIIHFSKGIQGLCHTDSETKCCCSATTAQREAMAVYRGDWVGRHEKLAGLSICVVVKRFSEPFEVGAVPYSMNPRAERTGSLCCGCQKLLDIQVAAGRQVLPQLRGVATRYIYNSVVHHYLRGPRVLHNVVNITLMLLRVWCRQQHTSRCRHCTNWCERCMLVCKMSVQNCSLGRHGPSTTCRSLVNKGVITYVA